MILFRAWAFNFSFYGLTAIMCLLFLPTLLMPAKAVFWAAKLWANAALWLAEHVCGIRMKIQGKEHQPNGPAIYAAKHQSAFETIALTALLKNPAFILKKELLNIPLFGWYLRRIGSIAIDRKAGATAMRQMVQSAKKRLETGHSVIIFAEGTRTSPDEENPRYLPGVAALYSKLEYPVVPVALNSGLCWGRLALLKTPGIVTIEFLSPLPSQLERQSFMNSLKMRIEQHSAVLRDKERARKARD